MKLLLDVGNSRIKWALLEAGRLSQQHSHPYQAENLKPLLDRYWDLLPQPDGVWVANVAGSAMALELAAWIERRWAVPLEFVFSAKAQLGVHNAYAEAHRLGVDRWLALLAAWHHPARQGACCVADCGTAVTLDVVDSQGEHRGGLILPGLNAQRVSLRHSAHALADVSLRDSNAMPSLPLGRNTRDGVAMGTLYAIASTLDHFFRQTAAAAETAPLALLSGGDAETILPWLETDWQWVPDLVLRGLALVADK